MLGAGDPGAPASRCLACLKPTQPGSVTREGKTTCFLTQAALTIVPTNNTVLCFVVRCLMFSRRAVTPRHTRSGEGEKGGAEGRYPLASPPSQIFTAKTSRLGFLRLSVALNSGPIRSCLTPGQRAQVPWTPCQGREEDPETTYLVVDTCCIVPSLYACHARLWDRDGANSATRRDTIGNGTFHCVGCLLSAYASAWIHLI